MKKALAGKTDWLLEERKAADEGFRCIAGIDEAGRGALAGPVAAACVILPPGLIPDGVNDSKALTPAQRDRAYDQIQRCATAIGIAFIEADRIDEINILKATHEAMRQALLQLAPDFLPDLALIDGLPVRPFPVPSRALVGGDSRSASIAAASIIAKVSRDRRMAELETLYPGYGFAGHKGYGVQRHLLALRELGPCAIHRRSYRPVQEALPCNRTAELELP